MYAFSTSKARSRPSGSDAAGNVFMTTSSATAAKTTTNCACTSHAGAVCIHPEICSACCRTQRIIGPVLAQVRLANIVREPTARLALQTAAEGGSRRTRRSHRGPDLRNPSVGQARATSSHRRPTAHAVRTTTGAHRPDTERIADVWPSAQQQTVAEPSTEIDKALRQQAIGIDVRNRVPTHIRIGIDPPREPDGIGLGVEPL